MSSWPLRQAGTSFPRNHPPFLAMTIIVMSLPPRVTLLPLCRPVVSSVLCDNKFQVCSTGKFTCSPPFIPPPPPPPSCNLLAAEPPSLPSHRYYGHASPTTSHLSSPMPTPGVFCDDQFHACSSGWFAYPPPSPPPPPGRALPPRANWRGSSPGRRTGLRPSPPKPGPTPTPPSRPCPAPPHPFPAPRKMAPIVS